MKNYQVILTAKEVDDCKIYKPKDKIILDLPEIHIENTDRICVPLIAALLKKNIMGERQEYCQLEEKFENINAHNDIFGIEISVYNRKGSVSCFGCEKPCNFMVQVKEKAQKRYQDDQFHGPSDTRMMLEKLKNIPIFSDIPHKNLAKIFYDIKVKKYPKGDIILEKGKIGQIFYIIYKGRVEVLDSFKGGGEKVIRVLEKRDCFGEMSLLTGEPTSTNIRALETCTLLALNEKVFQTLLSDNPGMRMKFIRLLSHHIKLITMKMSEVIATGIIGNLKTIQLPELIQTLCSANSSGVLHIKSDNHVAKIYVRDTYLIDVEASGKRGEEAFYEILRWSEGSFRFEQMEVVREQTIWVDPIGLLLEGMRRIDEASQNHL